MKISTLTFENNYYTSLSKAIFSVLFFFFVTISVLLGQNYTANFGAPGEGVDGPCTGTDRSTCTENTSGSNWILAGDYSGTEDGDYFKVVEGRLEANGTGTWVEFLTDNIEFPVGKCAQVIVELSEPKNQELNTQDEYQVDYSLDNGSNWITLNNSGDDLDGFFGSDNTADRKEINKIGISTTQDSIQVRVRLKVQNNKVLRIENVEINFTEKVDGDCLCDDYCANCDNNENKCPEMKEYDCDQVPATAQERFEDGGGSYADGCGTVAITDDFEHPRVCGADDMTITYTITNDMGTPSTDDDVINTCTQKVIINPALLPEIKCPENLPESISCADAANLTDDDLPEAPYTNGETGTACGIDGTVRGSIESNSGKGCNEIIILYAGEDPCGRKLAEKRCTIKIEDNEIPEITLKQGQDPTGTDFGCATEDDIPTPVFEATDNCGLDGEIEVTANTISMDCQYSKTFKANVMDSCANAADEFFITYTWDETPALTISCPEPVNLNTEGLSKSEIESRFDQFLDVFGYEGGCDVEETDLSGTELPDICEGGSVTVKYKITDKCGQKDSCEITFTIQPSTLTCSTIAPEDASCSGADNGKITVTAEGGTPDYEYSIDTGKTYQSENIFDGLAPGTYSISIQDANGCTTTCDEVTIDERSAVTCFSETKDASCNGGNDGSATVTGIGGTGTLSYEWPDGNTNATVDTLSAGIYEVTVTDENGCTSTCEVTVTEPGPLNCSIQVNNNTSCNGGNDGSATVTGIGGTGTLSYKWPDGNTNATVDTLSAGIYEVTVTDENGCTSTCEVTVTEPGPLNCSIQINNASCNGGNDGSATVTGSGGTGTLTYEWPDGNTNATVDTLSAGIYEVTVADENGCTSTCEVTITEISAPTCSIQVNNTASCNGGNDGSATVTGSGGTGTLSYEWPDGNTNATLDTLSAGIYEVTVTDENGCTSTCNVTISEPDPLELTCSTDPDDGMLDCNDEDGTVNVEVQGGIPDYSYNWVNTNEPAISIGTQASVTGLGAGTYKVVVTDANGCKDSCEVTLSVPNSPTFCITEECAGPEFDPLMTIVTVYPEGGTPGYEYQVLDVDDNSVIRDWTSIAPADTFMLPDGTYIIKMRDANECLAIAMDCDDAQTLLAVRSSSEVTSELEISLEAQCCRIVCGKKGWFECDDTEGIEDWLNGGAYKLEGACTGLTVKHNFYELKDCGKYIVTFTIVDNVTGEPELDDDGNKKSCTNTLIIKDTKSPVIVVKPEKKIWCEDKPNFDTPWIYDNCDDDVKVKVKTWWYESSYGHCYHRRTWTAIDDCGNSNSASQTLKIIDKSPPQLVPVHPLLKNLKSGDTLYAECDNPPFFRPDDFKVVNDCSRCPQHYKIKMDDYVKHHDCGYGKAIKEVVCWWYIYDEYSKKYIRYYIHIFIADRTPPKFISVPKDKTISCDDPIQFGKVAVKDNCSQHVYISHKDKNGVSEKGQSTITRVWTATDACGNSSTADQTITLKGSGPVFTHLPQDKILPAGSKIEFDEPKVSADCGEVTLKQVRDEVSGDECEGLIYTRTWKATTDNGLETTSSQTITVKPDKEAPVFSRMPGDIVIPCGSELPAFDITVSDNTDDGVIIETSETTEGEVCGQVINRTWTATDACGNSASVSQEIRFSDKLPITFTYVPGDVYLKIGDTIPEDMAMAESTCTEGEVLISVEDDVVLDSLCEQTINRLFIASDNCDNRDTAIQVITMIDDVAPELKTTLSNKSIECGDSVLFDTPEFEDNVGIESVVTTNIAVEELCEGSYKRTWQVRDSCGNTTEVSQTITILPDEEGPVFSVTDTITLIGCHDSPPDFEPRVVDNCTSAVSLTMEEETTGEECEEKIVREWTATDSCGNSSTLRWEIIRQDTTPPVFDHVPEDYSVTCKEDVVFDTITARDECGGDAELTHMDMQRQGDCFTGFEMVRTWTATDSCGNMAQIVQNIFVHGDTLAPVFSAMPADTILQCGDTIPHYMVDATDNCGVDTMWTRMDIRPEGEENCTDSTGYYVVRSWFAADQCGNLDTARQFIAVLGEGQDHLMAFVEVPPTQVVTCEDEIIFGTPLVKSTCDSVAITFEDFVTGEACSPEYRLIREWTATDTCGQSVSTYQTIIVQQDTLAPQLSLDHPVKFMGCGTDVDSLTFDEPAILDDCSSELVNSSDTTITDNSDADSVKVRTWTYTDACGNEASISQKLVFGLMDTDDFLRSERDTFWLSCVSELEAHRPVVYSCDTVVTSYEDVKSDSVCMNQLTIVRTWTAADTSGNEDKYVQVFYIHDTIAPVIEIASDTLYMTSLEYATNGAGSHIVSVTDNCGSAVGDIVIGKVEDDGEIRYEYEVAMGDECGNVTIRRFVVIIAEHPPVVDVSLAKNQVVAHVNGGVLPFDYSWSYLRTGSHTWTPADTEGDRMDLKGMGFLEKVKVRVTDAQDMTDEDELEILVSKKIHRYVTLNPNPAKDYVEVRMEMDDVDRIELYNVWGQRVKVYEMDEMDNLSRIQLDLRDVPQGSYSVRFLNDYRVYTRQLIKVQ